MKIVIANVPHVILAAALLAAVLQVLQEGKRQLEGGGVPLVNWLWRSARWLYGGYFAYTAVMIGRTL